MNNHMYMVPNYYPHEYGVNPNDSRLFGPWGFGFGFRPWGWGFGMPFGFGYPFFGGFPFFI